MDIKVADKKWFIYVGDHHEGPFTVHEIASGIIEGKFQKTGFVWCEGMGDWQPMSQLEEFNPRPKDVKPEPPIPSSPPQITKSTSTSIPGPEPISVEATKTKTTFMEMKELGSETSPGFIGGPPITEMSSQPKIVAKPSSLMGDDSRAAPSSSLHVDYSKPEKKKFLSKLKPIFFVVILLGGLFALKQAGVLQGLEEKIKSYTTSLPVLAGLSPEDQARLTAIVKTPISQAPAIDFAVSKEDPLSPAFYVVSNLSDGARFEIYVEGVPHTLLNTFEFSGKLDVVLMKHFGKSSPLRYPDGQVIPRGEYTLYLMEKSDSQPETVQNELSKLSPVARSIPSTLPQDRKLVLTRSVFLGQKDETYLNRLKEFHDKVLEKSKQERAEISQLLGLMESQYSVSVSNFERLRKQRVGLPQINAWNTSQQTWRQIDAQLSSSLGKLTPELLKSDYFYGTLYGKLQTLLAKLHELHTAQDSLFSRRANVGILVPQVMDLRAQYEQAASELKRELQTLESAPTDEHGLPAHASLMGASRVGI